MASDGSIDMHQMNYDPSLYNKRTDITFTLSGTVTDAHGNTLPVLFPGDPTTAVEITVPPGGSGSEIVPVAGASGTQLVLDDKDEDGDTYQYCLTPMVQSASGPIVLRLDPQIVNR